MLLLAPFYFSHCFTDVRCWGEEMRIPGGAPTATFSFGIFNFIRFNFLFCLLPFATGGISCNYSSLSVVCP